MSTVSIPRLPSIPAEVETYFDLQPATNELACPRCECVWIQPGHRIDLDRLCPQCERADAEIDAARLIADVSDLAHGRGTWAAIFPSDRRQLLQQIRAKSFVPPAAAVLPIMRVVGDVCCEPLGEPSAPADAPPPDVRAALEEAIDAQDQAAAIDEPSDEESDDGSDIGDRFERAAWRQGA